MHMNVTYPGGARFDISADDIVELVEVLNVTLQVLWNDKAQQYTVDGTKK